MTLYSEYINTLDQNQLNDYVFINFKTYSPLCYPAVKKLFIILSKKCGFYIRPHMLRHTHATTLVGAGWDMALVEKEDGAVSALLFPARRESKSPTISAAHLNRALKKLAQENNIVDNNGIIWKFNSHQFRHTVGTQMINSGVPQVMVQHYLGHESPEIDLAWKNRTPC